MVYIPQVLDKKQPNKLSSDQKFELLLENFPQVVSIFIAIQRAKINQQRGKERLKLVREKELQLERSGTEISNTEKLELKIEREEAEKDLSGNVYYFNGSPVMDNYLSTLARKYFLFRTLDITFLLTRFGFHAIKKILKEVYPMVIQLIERVKREQEKLKRKKFEKKLNTMTVKELRVIAAQNGLVNINHMKKEELLTKIRKTLGSIIHDSPDEEKSSSIIIDSDQLSKSLSELSKSLNGRKWIQNPFREKR